MMGMHDLENNLDTMLQIDMVQTERIKRLEQAVAKLIESHNHTISQLNVLIKERNEKQ